MARDEAGTPERVCWERVAETAPWSGRDSMGHFVHEDAIWLLGGYTPERVNDVWRSPDAVTWERTTPAAPWLPRNVPVAVSFLDRMWILGGAYAVADEPRRKLNDVWVSDDGAAWACVTESAPWAGRSAAGGVVYKDHLWVLGGMSMGEDFVHGNDVWRTADGEHWTRVTEHAPWSPRALFDAVVFQDALWILGGGVYNDAYPLNTVVNHAEIWRTEDGEQWDLVTAEPGWAPRRFHRTIVYKDRLWILGGHGEGTNRNDVWVSDDGAHWREAVGDPVWPIRHEEAAVVFHGDLWVIGGFDGHTLYNDTWRLRL